MKWSSKRNWGQLGDQLNAVTTWQFWNIYLDRAFSRDVTKLVFTSAPQTRGRTYVMITYVSKMGYIWDLGGRVLVLWGTAGPHEFPISISNVIILWNAVICWGTSGHWPWDQCSEVPWLVTVISDQLRWCGLSASCGIEIDLVGSGMWLIFLSRRRLFSFDTEDIGGRDMGSPPWQREFFWK